MVRIQRILITIIASINQPKIPIKYKIMEPMAKIDVIIACFLNIIIFSSKVKSSLSCAIKKEQITIFHFYSFLEVD